MVPGALYTAAVVGQGEVVGLPIDQVLGHKMADKHPDLDHLAMADVLVHSSAEVVEYSSSEVVARPSGVDASVVVDPPVKEVGQIQGMVKMPEEESFELHLRPTVH